MNLANQPAAFNQLNPGGNAMQQGNGQGSARLHMPSQHNPYQYGPMSVPTSQRMPDQ
jgi:hypothetical protein